tara:strand:- start:716 stop:1039 length:324 start_codon:yes stop_codon:yes gene_type:complete
MEDLAPIEINLNVSSKELNESFLKTFGFLTKKLLRYIFGDVSIPVNIKGTPAQVTSFANALSNEKRYMDSYLQNGLNDPRTHASRQGLNRAVSSFERETGIKWPFKS